MEEEHIILLVVPVYVLELNNGVLICWMAERQVPHSYDTNPQNVTLPISYSSTRYSTLISDTGSGILVWSGGYVNNSTIRVYNNTTTDSTIRYCNIATIGY